MEYQQIKNIIMELKVRGRKTTSKEILKLAKRRQIDECDILAEIEEMMRNQQIIKICCRNNSIIYELTDNTKRIIADELEYETEMLTEAEIQESDNFREEILDVVNSLYKAVECYKEQMEDEFNKINQKFSEHVVKDKSVSSDSRHISERAEITQLKAENDKLKQVINTKNQIIEKFMNNQKCADNQNGKQSNQIKKKEKKEKPESEQKNNNNKNSIKNRKNVFIVGDSMLNALEEKRLSNNKNFVKVKNHPGATSQDIIDHLRPIIRKKPDMIIVHAGTNDLTSNINYLHNVKAMVKEIQQDNNMETEIVFSSLFRRYDMKDGVKLVDDVNIRLKNYCHQNNIKLIDNSNITEELLGRKKLHPTKRGISLFARNILKFLNL